MYISHVVVIILDSGYMAICIDLYNKYIISTKRYISNMYIVIIAQIV